MRRVLATLLLSVLSLATASSDSLAAANAGAEILIHLQTASSKNLCGVVGQPACNQVVTAGRLTTLYYAFLVVTEGNAAAGVGGLQCGIHFNPAGHAGVDVLDWTLCATLEFPSTGWPNDGGGNIISWDPNTRCQRFEPGGPGTGVAANAGYFYLAAYSPDVFAVTPRPADGQARVVACNAVEDLIAGVGAPPGCPSLGSARFSADGNEIGLNPCGSCPDPIQGATWSAIKSLTIY